MTGFFIPEKPLLGIELLNSSMDIPQVIMDVLQDLIKCRLFKIKKGIMKEFSSTNAIHIYFHNKGIERLHLKKILKSIHFTISNFKCKDIPQIIYQRAPTI